MEIEAKYAITADFDPARIDALDVRPYTLIAAGAREHTDTLFDTHDRRVTSGRNALRARADHDGLTLTFKGPNTGSGGVHAREEWETSLPSPLTLDPSTWPDPIGSEVTRLAGNEKLAAIAHVVVQRRRWIVKRGARLIGELALDTGDILAATRREPVRELELELKGSGARTDLDTLGARLMAALPLQPETRSKLQRGLALLLHAKWTLDGYTPILPLATHYIRQKLRAAKSAKRDVEREGSPDAIHDMRVAIRRIRSALSELEAVSHFDREEARKLRRRLRLAARRLGDVRDLDIIIERVTAFSETRSGQEITNLLADLRQRRVEALAKVQRTIASGRFERALTRLRRCEIARIASDGAPDCIAMRNVSGGMLWRRFDDLAQHDTAIQLSDITEMHQARIAAKRMRYLLELLAPSMPVDIAPVRQALIAFQEAFGTLQDIAITRAAIEAKNKEHKDEPAFASLRRKLDAERERALAEARSAWAALITQNIRASLAAALAAL